MKTPLSDLVLDAGYETLFLLGGFLALSVHPTPRNLDQITGWIDDSQSRREHFRRLNKRGLITSDDRGGKWVPRITELGRTVFVGGRHPEEAWNRSWDGKWRLLTFDLPRNENRARMKLRRWLCSNHFGRLQGSVWIRPDPVPAIGEVITSDRLDPTMVMVFEGGLAGSPKPRKIAAMAWDYDAINGAYRAYSASTQRVLKQVRNKPPSLTRLREILAKDRHQWLDAVRRDPLLPKALIPKGYEGTAAWKSRSQLLMKLDKSIHSKKP